MLSQSEIDDLIACTKRIEQAEPFKGMNTERRSYRKNLDLKAVDHPHLFKVFIRQSVELIEDFSIGLIYKSGDRENGSMTLIRFNGSHGALDWSMDRHYTAFHIHRMTEKDLQCGIREPKAITVTTRYATLECGLMAFFEELHIENWASFFPELKQPTLFPVVGGGS